MSRRSSNSWNRNDSVLILASFFEHGVPHEMERQRMANILGMPYEAVMKRYNAYRELEAGREAPERETKLWHEFCEDRISCLLLADEITEERRVIPYHLRKRLQ